MDGIKEWEEFGGNGEAFYSDGEPAREQDVEWVANFRSEALYRKCIPHITLGFGDAPAPEAAFDFIASRVGLFHLGRYCTCRKLIRDWELVYQGER